jgi:hypothetical protein
VVEGPVGRKALSFLALASLLLLGTNSEALAGDRPIEITPFLGYQFGGQIQTTQGDVQLNDALNWGGTVGVNLRPGTWAELTYNNQSTQLQLDTGAFGGGVEDVLDVTVHYIHIGGRYDAAHEGRVVGFGAGGLGITIFDPQSEGFDSETRFSVDLAGGVLAPVSHTVAIRAQIRGWFNVMDTGSTVWCSGGCYGTVSGWLVAQGELSGGLVFRL